MNMQEQGWIQVVGDEDRIYDLDGELLAEVIEDDIPMAELIDDLPMAELVE